MIAVAPARARPAALLAAAAVALGCGSGGSPTVARSPEPTAAATVALDPSIERALTNPAVVRMLKSCRVTLANRSRPPGQERNPGVEAIAYHGQDGLWTVLPQRGVLVVGSEDVDRDGSFQMKFPWWRATPGELEITGRRLDRGSGGLRARVPSGYGATGFQASRLVFAGEGCWEVTGRAGDAELTFVTLVVRARPQ